MTNETQLRSADVPSGLRLGRALGEIVGGVLVAAVVCLALQWVINRLPMPQPTTLPSVVIMLGCGAAVVVIVGVLVLRPRRWVALPLSWAALSAAVTVPLSSLLNGTRYYLGGMSVDQSFRTEYLTRMADSPRLADMAFVDVPPFYPAGWFWLGGRFANAFGLPGWAAYKPFAILTMAVAGAVVLALWRLSVGPRAALGLAAITVVVGLPLGAPEPYGWLVAATLPPVAALLWRLLASLAGGARPPVTAAVAVGVIFGVYGCLYTLYVGFAVLVGLVAAVAVTVRQALRRRADPSAASVRQVAPRLVGHVVLAGAAAAVVMCLVWLPYLFGAATGTPGRNLSSRYLPLGGAQFPEPFLDFSLSGALCLAGLVWLVVAVVRRGPYRRVATALAVTAATVYLWYVLSQLALVAHTTLLAFRVGYVLNIVLVCAAALGVTELLQWVVRTAPADWRRIARVLSALLAAAVLLQPLQQSWSTLEGLEHAREDYYPTGQTPGGSADRDDNGYWVPKLAGAIRTMTGRPPDQNVVLGGGQLLLNTKPYWRFQGTSPHYSNPLAGFAHRNELIESWARTRDPARLQAALRRATVTPPSAFVFYRKGGALTLSISRDVFPHQPNVAGDTVRFDPAAFAGPAFRSRTVGPYTVVVRTGARPAQQQ